MGYESLRQNCLGHSQAKMWGEGGGNTVHTLPTVEHIHQQDFEMKTIKSHCLKIESQKLKILSFGFTIFDFLNSDFRKKIMKLDLGDFDFTGNG